MVQKKYRELLVLILSKLGGENTYSSTMDSAAVHGAGLRGVVQPFKGQGQSVPSTVELEAVQRKLNLLVVSLRVFGLTW